MRALLLSIDQFLRREDQTATTTGALFRRQLPIIIVCGLLYGALMGSYRGLGDDGWKQIFLSATKVPVLFFVTFLLCLPSFFVLNALAGLHADFPRVLRALLSFQALAVIVLAALGPITELMNLSTPNYGFMILWNGAMFAVASSLGHWRLRWHYRPLIAAHPRHRQLLLVWTLLYWFVAIQMAWVLRPFVGDPTKPFQILRPQAWGNAYIEVANLIWRVVGR